MGLTNKKEIETNKVELEISVDAAEFQKAVDLAFKKNVHKMSVPGFRKGKAPRSIVEKLYGESVFYEDAVNDCYPAAYEAAVQEAGIEPVDRANIEILSVEKEGVTFKATVTTKPEVEIGEYKGLKGEKVVKTVNDADVDAEIDRLRQKNSRMITIEDRPAQKDDTAIFDFEGFVDGKAFDGGKAEKYTLQLGSGQFIPGFEDQMIGHSIGEEFDVNVTFPEDYQSEELKGKPAVFKIKLHELKMRELPEVDDELAKDVSEFDTLAELKDSIAKKLQESIDKAAGEAVENNLIDQIIDGMKAEIPEVMFEQRIDHIVQDFDYRLQMQGMELAKYLEYTGMDYAAFRKTFRDQAEKQVKIRLALEKIVKLENIAPTAEEIEAEYESTAKKYNMEVNKIKELIPDSDFVMDMAVNKAIDLVKDSAVITEVAEETKNDDSAKEEAPKKVSKPRAKKAKAEAEEVTE